MDITVTRVLDGKALLYTLSGPFDPQHMLQTAQTRYRNPEHNDIAAYLWDVRNLNLPESYELRESTQNVAATRSAREDNRPAVIIVDRIGSAQYGMARMWQNTFDFPMEIVDSLEQALETAQALVDDSR